MKKRARTLYTRPSMTEWFSHNHNKKINFIPVIVASDATLSKYNTLGRN